jgi:hypothetical protein
VSNYTAPRRNLPEKEIEKQIDVSFGGRKLPSGKGLTRNFRLTRNVLTDKITLIQNPFELAP